MSDVEGKPFDQMQLSMLQRALHPGSANASEALAKWVGKQTVVELDSLVQLTLDKATSLLGNAGNPVCFCSMAVQGVVGGEMILVFDDQNGFALADLLQEQPEGTTDSWDELAISAVMETANILCCAYLNSLSTNLLPNEPPLEIVPAAPTFNREFPESLLQFAFMDQAIAFEHVLASETRFQIDGVPMQWAFLFIPDAESMPRLVQLLVADRHPG